VKACLFTHTPLREGTASPGISSVDATDGGQSCSENPGRYESPIQRSLMKKPIQFSERLLLELEFVQVRSTEKRH